MLIDDDRIETARPTRSMSVETVKSYKVWDAPTRWFHWVNAVMVVLLLISGFLFMYREVFRIESVEAKYALMIAHVLIGYVFTLNLLIRVIWGFSGNRYARWRAMLPNWRSLHVVGAELQCLIERRPFKYIGRSPLSRVSVTVMFVLLLAEASSGLIRAGIDLYYPPFGRLVATYVVKPKVDPATVTWQTTKESVDPNRWQHVRPIKKAMWYIHTYSAYLLLAMMLLHVAGVALTEVRQHSGLVSAMFSGRKVLVGTPVDADEFDRKELE